MRLCGARIIKGIDLSIHEKKIEGVPQFVSYFQPVLEILRDLGGQAKPRQVYDEVIQRYNVPADFLEKTNSNGRPKFENRVAWARFYLAKAGLLYSPKRGIWALTQAGETENLTEESAVELFRTAHAAFKGDEDEEQAPENEVVPEGVNYWFVGSAWREGDQTERFLAEGIWQNGYDEKFAKIVNQMKSGDRIAIKATYVRKHDVPFDNQGRSVSAMKIKAIGTVLENRGDGQTVDVSWENSEPKEWFLYTYRSTVTRARFEDDDFARQLVAFTFDGQEQNYARFLANPYWKDRYAPDVEPLSEIEDEDQAAVEDEEQYEAYAVEDIVFDGGFLEEGALSGIVDRLIYKKNVILQGPPGTGKTWLAKRLAKALIGRKSPRSDQLRSVQFHPSLSYEDFVRGYRPSSEGLVITDGIFLQVVEAAKAQPDVPHILIIEEINRGNPAQVFGEMLTLLESTKRSRVDAMELAYRKTPGERVHVPDNVHLIGTMNIADRSLALVDLALRRRFAFVTLEPLLNGAWSKWCLEHGMDEASIAMIKERMEELNSKISEDRSLGEQFRVGHSYVTPAPNDEIEDPKAWFKEIVETEIGPLLDEYWFDAPDQANEAVTGLLAGI